MKKKKLIKPQLPLSDLTLKAYNMWVNAKRTHLHLDGSKSCCNNSHFDEFNNLLDINKLCERERAWQYYLALRDKDQNQWLT